VLKLFFCIKKIKINRILQSYINTLQKDPCNSEKEAVLHIYSQLRNAEPPDEATARDVIDKLFFSDKRYDLGRCWALQDQ
jgi:hypothetical protein